MGLRYEPDMGHELLLHATANGQAWLATLPENEALRLVCTRGFDAMRPLGERAVKNVDDLRRHLAETRSRGYATAVEEAEVGTAALAVPFFSDDTDTAPAAGTISIAGPLVRIGPERFEELSGELRAAAKDVTALWPLRNRQRGVRVPTAGSRGPETVLSQ